MVPLITREKVRVSGGALLPVLVDQPLAAGDAQPRRLLECPRSLDGRCRYVRLQSRLKTRFELDGWSEVERAARKLY